MYFVRRLDRAWRTTPGLTRHWHSHAVQFSRCERRTRSPERRRLNLAQGSAPTDDGNSPAGTVNRSAGRTGGPDALRVNRSDDPGEPPPPHLQDLAGEPSGSSSASGSVERARRSAGPRPGRPRVEPPRSRPRAPPRRRPVGTRPCRRHETLARTARSGTSSGNVAVAMDTGRSAPRPRRPTPSRGTDPRSSRAIRRFSSFGWIHPSASPATTRVVVVGSQIGAQELVLRDQLVRDRSSACRTSRRADP